mgnify:CR=1 FL=1
MHVHVHDPLVAALARNIVDEYRRARTVLGELFGDAESIVELAVQLKDAAPDHLTSQRKTIIIEQSVSGCSLWDDELNHGLYWFWMWQNGRWERRSDLTSVFSLGGEGGVTL